MEESSSSRADDAEDTSKTMQIECEDITSEFEQKLKKEALEVANGKVE